ncbi:PTH1 family peptidyl-tRNA hydrolase [Ereboglobus sp. PH5-10]|uniref:aminoacyl-tRNA hydrolase n=1 Tax=Ereboglobus sp. PH5-10 TaxID=2940629 RepID=UPI002405F1FA|nr:aminoacyl-tRNA hydrolase [Ereboglobus sp. PH5-10]MDF9828033.1 PTH1 family peptidyl-tRNA hydrolase [Ereboglobus sp. PH5-10]
MSILLVAGLGNPGREYANTRHNLGFIILDALARRHALPWKMQAARHAEITRWDNPPGGAPLLLAKPQTYMNESGVALQSLARYYKIPVAQIAVIYDDINIDLGLVKVSRNGSAGGHNGIASILQHLGDGFIRYRIGIGPKRPPKMDLKDFVLGNLDTNQQTIVANTLPHYLNGLDILLEHGTDRAMNTLNRREKNT